MSELSAELERTFSAQDLIKPENCLSAIKKRIFVQKTSFESKDDAKTVIADAKSVFPEIKSSYTPSGKNECDFGCWNSRVVTFNTVCCNSSYFRYQLSRLFDFQYYERFILFQATDGNDCSDF